MNLMKRLCVGETLPRVRFFLLRTLTARQCCGARTDAGHPVPKDRSTSIGHENFLKVVLYVCSIKLYVRHFSLTALVDICIESTYMKFALAMQCLAQLDVLRVH